MIDKWIDKIEAYHVWRVMLALVILEVIGAFYLFLYLWELWGL